MYTNARGVYETKGMNMMNMNMNLFINLNQYSRHVSDMQVTGI